MPRNQRLVRADFTNSGRNGARRVSGALFSLSIQSRQDGKGSRAAVVVSKKVAVKAVERNLLRRRAREVLRHRLAELKRPVALAFYAKSAARGATFAAIRADIDRLIAQMR